MNDWFSRLQRFNHWSMVSGNRFILIRCGGGLGLLFVMTFVGASGREITALSWGAAFQSIAYVAVVGVTTGIAFGIVTWWLSKAIAAYVRRKRH